VGIGCTISISWRRWRSTTEGGESRYQRVVRVLRGRVVTILGWVRRPDWVHVGCRRASTEVVQLLSAALAALSLSLLDIVRTVRKSNTLLPD